MTGVDGFGPGDAGMDDGSSGGGAFIKCLLIVGLESSSGLEASDEPRPDLSRKRRIPSMTSSTASLSAATSTPDVAVASSPLERSYKPKMLRRYPDVEPWPNFNPDAVSRLVLPQGLRFRTDHGGSSGLENPCSGYQSCHPFVLTREDGVKSHGVSMVFFEKVCDPDICQGVYTLQKMHRYQVSSGLLPDLNSELEQQHHHHYSAAEGYVDQPKQAPDEKHHQQRRPSNHLIDNVQQLSSSTTMNRSAASRERPRSARVSSERSRSLPRHYQHTRLSTGSTIDLSPLPPSSSSSYYYDCSKDTLYVTKAVALILNEALISVAEKILVSMHKYINKSDFSVKVLEGVISTLLHDTPLPGRGRSVRFWCLGEVLALSMPKVPDELPLFDFDLLQFFAILGVENAIKLWVCVLLENQVIVYSADPNKLVLVCESVSALAYPFSWPHVYVPVLPPFLEGYLDAPVPYIMGLLRRTHDHDLYNRCNVCIVDIDNGELELPEELPEFPQEFEMRKELERVIADQGGSEGEALLKEHALLLMEDVTDVKNSSTDNLNLKQGHNLPRKGNEADNNDSMSMLSEVIQKFEALSQQHSKSQQQSAVATKSKDLERLILNNAVREVFVNRFAHIFLRYENFVIVPNKTSNLPQLGKNGAEAVASGSAAATVSSSATATTTTLLQQMLEQETSAQNFDRTSFLSDQNQADLPFLAAFLETQMFTDFVDSTIDKMLGNNRSASQSLDEDDGSSRATIPHRNRPGEEETPFEIRLRLLLNDYENSLTRAPTAYQETAHIEATSEILKKRLKKVEVTVTPQKVVVDSGLGDCPDQGSGVGIFPMFDPVCFVSSKNSSSNGNPWRRSNHVSRRRRMLSNSCSGSGSKDLHHNRNSMSIDITSIGSGNSNSNQKLLNANQASSIAETNWNFVELLLTECKQRTKRILLEKLGHEAIDWGHNQKQESSNFDKSDPANVASTIDSAAVGSSPPKPTPLPGSRNITTSFPNVFGSEENMLVASICDLIERIWSHGLRSRQRKSAFWHYLVKFGISNEHRMRFKGALGAQAYVLPLMAGSKPFILPDHSRPIQVLIDPSGRSDAACLDFSSILVTMHNVSTMHEIKTEIGYSRAWIRLALQRKCLSQYLHVMLSNYDILKSLYKRYAFLRCEDEREQSLFHLQTLNTVDFSCFTNAYAKSSILYQALIFPSQKNATANKTSANVWMQVVGTLGETACLQIPSRVVNFCFWWTNLGSITSLRLAHDNSGNSPNWLVEHVLVRNEFTGQIFKFTCGRWLGQNVDDGSTERYMVGYPVLLPKDSISDERPSVVGSSADDLPELVHECSQSPTDTTCPAMQLKTTGAREGPEAADITSDEVVQLQTILGDAINKIVKYHHKSLNESSIGFTHLMCGKLGLVHALIYIFSYGYKSVRLFGKNLFVWDFFLKVTMDFNQSLQFLLSGSPMTSSMSGLGGVQLNSLSSSTYKTPTAEALGSPKRLGGINSRTLSPHASVSPVTSGRPSKQGSGGGATLSRANQFRQMYTKLITKIETTCHRLGKDDKFQLFVCLAVHDRLLGRIITDLTKAVAAKQLYEEHAFLRNPSLTSFLSHILGALDDISVPVDPALKQTLEQHYYSAL